MLLAEKSDKKIHRKVDERVLLYMYVNERVDLWIERPLPQWTGMPVAGKESVEKNR